MSDQWVGPGWWMASDGKWYPPRTPSASGDAETGDIEENPERVDGRPTSGVRAVSSPQSRAEQAASRAQRAANLPRPGVVSVNGRADAQIDDPVDADDAADVIDLRDEVVAKAEASIGGSENVEEMADVADAEAYPARALASVTSLTSAVTPQRGTPDGAVPPVPPSGANFSSSGSTNGSMWPQSDADHREMGSDGEHVDDEVAAPPLQHAVLPEIANDREVTSSPRGARTLLVVATGLAVLSGVLGALWLRERSTAVDLRAEIEQSTVDDDVTTTDVSELSDELNTLRLQNEQLRSQLSDMSALVLELPAGRVTEIVVPFTPVFADEENGRFIAVGGAGEYVVWADGADAEITDSGTLGGRPTGVFAATAKAWIATDAGMIEIVSLNNTEGLPSVEFGPSDFMAAEERAYWTYEREGGNVVRLRKSDGGVTASVSVPVPVVDLTIGAGSVWALGDDGRVYRINTADFTVQAIDAGADLISITAGPDALWTLSAADGSLRRVDPVSGEVLVTVPVGRDPIDATFAGSSVWVALRSGTSLIEVDTRTAAVISRTALPGTPTALHEGDSGVFVTLEGDVPLVRVASLTQPIDDADADAEVDVADDAVEAG